MTGVELAEVITQEVIRLHRLPQQLYLIVDRFSPPGCGQTSGSPSALNNDLVQHFTHTPTDRQRDGTALLHNIYAVMSTTNRINGRPF